MLPTFDSLREELLRAGIAPRRVHRYVAELREHLADLTAQELASGLDAERARERARTLLGADAELARAMLQRAPELSLATRAPSLVFVLCPALLLIGATFLSAVLMMHALRPMQGLTPAEMPDHYRTLIGVANVGVNYLLAAALCAGCVTVALRQRLVSAWVWVGLGLVTILNGFLGFHLHVFPAAEGHSGGAVYSLVDFVYVREHISAGATIAVSGLHAFVLFAIAAVAYQIIGMRLKSSNV